MTDRSGKNSSRVLVTGAGGFVGSHLARELFDRGDHVVAIDLHLERVKYLKMSGRFELMEADVADPRVQRRALEGVDTVYHLAAAHLSVSAADEEFWRVNVDGLRSLVRNAVRAGVRRFVHCSSVGVYGHIDKPPADETTPCNPELVYEKTKLEGERVVLEVARECGLPAVILRPVWVYGPGCPRTEKLFRAIKKGRFVVAGSGQGLRHCVYISDMVDAFRLAAQSEDALGEVIIVGDNRPVTIRRLVDEMARLTGSRPPRSIPLSLFSLLVAVVEVMFRVLGKEPPMSRRSIKFFTANTAFDISRAKRLLGYEPKVDLARGLAQTYRHLSGDVLPPLPASH